MRFEELKGEHITSIRKRYNLTIEGLAAITGVSAKTISRIEKDKVGVNSTLMLFVKYLSDMEEVRVFGVEEKLKNVEEHAVEEFKYLLNNTWRKQEIYELI